MAQVRRRGHILKNEDLHVTATGYGRNVFQADKRVAEITCHAAGAHYLAPEASTVLDIGGQDSKVITLGPDSRVTDFLMNDKCAAGTRRFLQNMAVHLGCSLQDFAAIPENTPFQPINNMCTVFAESEVIGLLAQGVAKESICLGLLDSVAQRAANLISRISDYGDICFIGGCAERPARKADRTKDETPRNNPRTRPICGSPRRGAGFRRWAVKQERQTPPAHFSNDIRPAAAASF